MSDPTNPTQAPSLPRVLVVDDHALFRAGVIAELGDAVEVVGQAASVAEALQRIQETGPDVVLLDVHLPGGGGQTVIREASIPTRFLALSVSDAPEDVIGLVRAGARGYVTKLITATELVDAILRVADGDAVFSPDLPGMSSMPSAVRNQLI